MSRFPQLSCAAWGTSHPPTCLGKPPLWCCPTIMPVTQLWGKVMEHLRNRSQLQHVDIVHRFWSCTTYPGLVEHPTPAGQGCIHEYLNIMQNELYPHSLVEKAGWPPKAYIALSLDRNEQPTEVAAARVQLETHKAPLEFSYMQQSLTHNWVSQCHP